MQAEGSQKVKEGQEGRAVNRGEGKRARGVANLRSKGQYCRHMAQKALQLFINNSDINL